MSDKTFTQDEVNKIVQERLDRDRQARVVHEPRTYSADGAHSFYADTILARVLADENAQRRLEAHAREVAHEVVRGTSEGRYAERTILTRTRTHDEALHREAFEREMNELRSLTTGAGVSAGSAGSGSVFVSPYFLLDQWAPYRGRRRPFADQCISLPMPVFGMHAYIPAFTSPGTSAEKQTEGSAITEGAPQSALEGTEVQTITSRVNITQQFLDRAFGSGGNIDVILGLQMQQQMEEQVDLHVLEQAIKNGSAVTGTSTVWKTNSFEEQAKGFARFYEDLAAGREKMFDESGTRLRPTHFFTTSDFYSFATKLTDAQGRPILQLTQRPLDERRKGAQGADNLEDVPKWSRFTGTVLPGGVMWFTDDNIPTKTVGTVPNCTQLIVSAPDEALVLVEDVVPTLTLMPQTVGNKLEVVVIQRKYAAAITRHAAGSAIINGTAYLNALA